MTTDLRRGERAKGQARGPAAGACSPVTLTVGDLGQVFDGPHATPTRQTTGTKYFLNISSLSDGRLDLTRSDRVNDTDFVNWTRRVQPREGDLLFSYETRLGEAALMPTGIEACLGRRMALLRPNRAVVDPRFLLYLWLSPQFQQTIANRSIRGATVDRIPLKDLGAWPLHVPSLPIQQAIGEVLGALDDKIAANLRALSGADDLLRQLYERLETPTRRRLADVANHHRRQVDQNAVQVSDNYVGLEHFDPRSVWLVRNGHGSEVSSAKNGFQAGDTLFGKLRPNFHKVAIANRDGVCSTDIIVLRPKQEEWRWFVAAAAGADAVVARAVRNSNGTKMPRAKWADIAECEVPDPEAPASQEFSGVAGTLIRRGWGAVRENQRLAATRDELLPLLMNGRITVKDAERRVEGEV